MPINQTPQVGDSGHVSDHTLIAEAITLMQTQIASLSGGGLTPDATSSTKGKIQIAGDIGGSASLIFVTSTHLTNPLPVNQGGTGTDEVSWVGNTGDEEIDGIKTFLESPVIPDPTADNQAASQGFVNSTIQGKNYKDSVRAATAAVLPTNTRTSNVLTASSNGALSAVDGVTLVLNDRVLVKNEATGANNGLYYVSAVGSGGAPWTLTRTTDADISAEVTAGLTVLVEEGTANADAQFTLTTNNPITLNTTALTFSKTLAAGSSPISTGLIGNGSLTTIPYTHNLGTQYVDARVYDAATNNVVGCEISLTSSSVVTFAFVGGYVPATNSLRAVVRT